MKNIKNLKVDIEMLTFIVSVLTLIIAFLTYSINKEQRNIARYDTEPQFVIDLLTNSEYGINKEITKSIDEGEIPYQTLLVKNMGKFNASINVEPYIAVFNVRRTKNGDDSTAINIPIKVDRFFLHPYDIELDENNNEIYKEQIYINYMRELSGAVTAAVNELNSIEVQNYTGGTTVQTEVNYVYYLKISYKLDKLDKKEYRYYKVRPKYGSEEITAFDYEKIVNLSDSIDMLDFENEIYEIIKTKK